MFEQWSEQEELEFLLNHPLIGGDGEGEGDDSGDGDGKQDEAGVGDSQANKEGERDSGDTGGKPPKDGQWIPKHRFDEVNTKFSGYKDLGSPDQIKASLARLRELEALPANRTNNKEKAEIRKEILDIFPELNTLTTNLENQRTSYVESATEVNNGFLKELGIEVNEANNQYLQELLSGVIARDEKLRKRFWAMDPTVLPAAFAIAKKTFWPNARKPVPGAPLQNKKILPKPPSNQKVGEEGSTKKKTNGQMGRLEERDIMDQASEEAFAMLESSRQE